MTGEGMSHQATSPVAVVTGGCGDIGRAVGLRLARDGFAVVLADLLDVSTGEAIASELSRAQPQAPALRYVRLDVTDRPQVDALFERLGAVDLVVANAGIGRSAPVLELTQDEWQAHQDINLTGCFNTGQAAARQMTAAGRPGSIIFTSSWIGTVPWPEMTAYSVSKAGIEMLAKQFARELAGRGIRANVVAPGIVRAGMARVQLETEPQYAARVAKVVPLNRLQTVDDVAGAVSFLAGPDGSYCTGMVLTTDGGASLFAFD